YIARNNANRYSGYCQPLQLPKLIPLGVKDYSLPGNGIDASDQDGGINITNWPVVGLYQPDAIASFSVNGQTYYNHR
ncbi:MAG: hypothetical protein HEQ10_23380, partial [Dolichospermum sp. DEX182a]|nr:hypothetical protein [Dolichospermum sp. DEX182a]